MKHGEDDRLVDVTEPAGIPKASHQLRFDGKELLTIVLPDAFLVGLSVREVREYESSIGQRLRALGGEGAVLTLQSNMAKRCSEIMMILPPEQAER